MSRPINHKRAGWAARAVKSFSASTGSELWSEAIGDLLCDLGHLCDSRQLDFVAIAEHAIGTWQIERVEPDGVSLPPAVSIRVSAARNIQTPRHHRR
jgi:hypothetical protein